MKALCAHPLFGLGLVVRAALILTLAPAPASDWYAPFMDLGTSRLAFDPWSLWLDGGGDPAAFPYGYAMWLVLAAPVLAAKALALPPLYGYALALLAADLALLAVLRRLAPAKPSRLLAAWWLSPIVILATYGLGLNDAVAVLFLILSILLLRDARPASAGAACAAAVSAKLSMAAALPLFAIYMLRGHASGRGGPRFAAGLLACAAVLFVPFAASHGGLRMLFENPDMDKIYRPVLDLGANASIYVAPAVYVVIMYMVWRVRRFNFDLFVSTAGIVFFSIAILALDSPGWFVWVVPFLAYRQLQGDRADTVLVGAFSAAYVASVLLVTPLRFPDGGALHLGALAAGGWGQERLAPLLHTGMVAVGAILVMRIYREAIARNDFFRLSRRPFAIGIAGDSGAGKDYLASALADLIGERSAVRISGDDYHLWDRRKPMWRIVTHLNPLANDIDGFGRDLAALVNGRSIRSRRYDHREGKRGRPRVVDSNHFIIASGLHALYLPIFRECYDLAIYLDMDETLRRRFKIDRDTNERGHAPDRVLDSIARREPDSRRFIRPQKAHADLTLALRPAGGPGAGDGGGGRPPRLMLAVRTRRGFNELSLTRVLVAVCGLRVDMSVEDSAGGAEMALEIEGDPAAEDIALAAGRLCPRTLPFLAARPGWRGGAAGLMQLIVLCHVDQALTRRLL